MPVSWQPPFEPSRASQAHSFARESTIHRWPTIVTGIIDQLNKLNNRVHVTHDEVAEGKRLIEQLAKLVYEMRHDRALAPLQVTGNRTTYPDDLDQYNDEIEHAETSGSRLTWFSASWLFAECYLYRRIRCLFEQLKHFQSFDPFAQQKIDTFRSSKDGIMALARTMKQLIDKGRPTDKDVLHADWVAMIEVCLWGNVERGKEFFLHNDINTTWNHVKTFSAERFDIVLDNSGFELFSDLVFADWLVTLSPFASQVVFHPKLIPWFVSDVQPHDFKLTLEVLADSTFFGDDEPASESDKMALKEMVTRWQKYVDEGKFKLAVPVDLKMGEGGGELADFWTSPWPFTEMGNRAPQLLKELQKSSLVIFKGDLNYRKLTSDAWWPTTTSFDEAIGPLRGLFPILSLRTCKADVCVGLEPGKAEELDEKEPKWRVNGKYAVVSFCPAA
ncbi:Hairy/enhancer-of-split with YRPW motif protein 2 [Microbotryomycetes sp. JL201]|nr:Hairy/enhancer-of-split with YRPW motif protein 2 [Microbotryomycetes sp. JL201]